MLRHGEAAIRNRKFFTGFLTSGHFLTNPYTSLQGLANRYRAFKTMCPNRGLNRQDEKKLRPEPAGLKEVGPGEKSEEII
jgi:hypothetical protein